MCHVMWSVITNKSICSSVLFTCHHSLFVHVSGRVTFHERSLIGMVGIKINNLRKMRREKDLLNNISKHKEESRISIIIIEINV